MPHAISSEGLQHPPSGKLATLHRRCEVSLAVQDCNDADVNAESTQRCARPAVRDRRWVSGNPSPWEATVAEMMG